jgi:diguanylate cyclase (GGDEF)-like protein
MDRNKRNGNGATPSGRPERSADTVGDLRRERLADQAVADADQSASDADQSLSDEDQAASAHDQITADRDQLASDRDQATADRDRAADGNLTAEDQTAYTTSRDERETTSSERLENRNRRGHTARERNVTADARDRVAHARDVASDARDERMGQLARSMLDPDAFLLDQLEKLAGQIAVDRARAAADRSRAARDRANAARERARLETELMAAHLDHVTGAYRREMGELAIDNEVNRARRGDGRFVLAFVDVDGLKLVNDRDGHIAGDAVLKTVVRAMRTNLRSFDPIMRYGGDEFVCGMSGTDLDQAERRFALITANIEAEIGVTISVGLAALADGQTAEELTARADAAMLAARAERRSGG